MLLGASRFYGITHHMVSWEGDNYSKLIFIFILLRTHTFFFSFHCVSKAPVERETNKKENKRTGGYMGGLRVLLL